MTNLASIGRNQLVAEALVVSLTTIMQNELVNSIAQRAFTKEDHSVQAVGDLGGNLTDPTPPAPAIVSRNSPVNSGSRSDKISTRMVIGVASLPVGTPVELEVVFEVTP